MMDDTEQANRIYKDVVLKFKKEGEDNTDATARVCDYAEGVLTEEFGIPYKDYDKHFKSIDELIGAYTIIMMRG